MALNYTPLPVREASPEKEREPRTATLETPVIINHTPLEPHHLPLEVQGHVEMRPEVVPQVVIEQQEIDGVQRSEGAQFTTPVVVPITVSSVKKGPPGESSSWKTMLEWYKSRKTKRPEKEAA